jgi:hypothetical protein
MTAVAYFKYYHSTAEAGKCTSFRIILFKAVPHLRRLVSGILPRRPGFTPRPIHVGFVVDKVALGQVFLQVLRFPTSVSFKLIHLVTDATKSQYSLTTLKVQFGPMTSPKPHTYIRTNTWERFKAKTECYFK